MSLSAPNITPCLWYDGQAEEAANFYTSIFPRSKIIRDNRYTEAGADRHRQQPGSVMVVQFELDGRRFTALNGGPMFKFNEAVSFVIDCKDQAEVDYYWEKLGEGGGGKWKQCGWLADRFGLNWQVVPVEMKEIMDGEDREGAKRAMAAMMKMNKLDVQGLRDAFRGEK